MAEQTLRVNGKKRTPVKVTAWLSSPLAGNAPMLDGLLEWAMLRHMPSIRESSGGHRHMVQRGGYERVPIPLGESVIGGHSIAMASSPILPIPEDEWSQKMARPMVVDPELIGERKKLNTSSGPNKSCLIPIRGRLVDRIVWFAVAEGGRPKWKTKKSTGDRYQAWPSAPCSLRKVLQKITAIGSKCSQGFGVVDRWDVEPIEQDWSWFAPIADGSVLMRPLPAGDHFPNDMQGARLTFGCFRGPYHDKRNAGEVMVPC